MNSEVIGQLIAESGVATLSIVISDVVANFQMRFG
jgi:hypothetical protein